MLLTSVTRGSNPVIGNFYLLSSVGTYGKDKKCSELENSLISTYVWNSLWLPFWNYWRKVKQKHKQETVQTWKTWPKIDRNRYIGWERPKPENNHLRGKWEVSVYGRSQIWLDWILPNNIIKCYLYKVKLLIPNKSNWRLSVQWYFHLL